MINIVQINMEERLQKYLAECGIASRRKCEEYIIQGKSSSKWKNNYRTRC